MKKEYMQPSVMMVQTRLAMIICDSQGITSDKGIDYGGVDEDGTKEPAARRYSVWNDEEEELE